MTNTAYASKKLSWLLIPRGLIIGVAVGVTARLWMRWISTDPEFTWGGTLGIVIGFGIFGAVQSLVRIVVSKGNRRWLVNVVRTFGVIFSLQLFLAAGASMFPTVLTGSLAVWRDRWKLWLRSILGVLSIGWMAFIIQTAIVKDFGWTIATIGRIILMAVIYIWIISSLKSTVRRFQ